MQSNSKTANPVGYDPHMMQQYSLHPESWWRNIPYGGPAAAPPGNASNLSSSEDPNGSVSTDRQSMSNGRSNEENDVSSKELQNSASSQSVYQRNLQLVTSGVTTMHAEGRAPQLELVGHSVACASNPYQDPYFCGMMAAYGPQPLPYPPHLMGLPHTRMPLPQEMAQEPVYVNAKQFQGIMRRRQARAKAELEKKLVKVRKPYLHESRHQHAMRRPRGTGGRFAKKTEAETKGVKPSDSGRLISSLSVASSGSDPLPSEPDETRLNGGTLHQNHINMHASMYQSQTGDKGEDGSGQQWVKISSSSSAQRSLAIQ